MANDAAGPSAGLLDVSQAVIHEQLLPHIGLRDYACLSRTCSQLRAFLIQAPADLWQQAAAATLPKRHPSLPLSLPEIRDTIQQWHRTQQNLQAKAYTFLTAADCRAADSSKCAAPCLSPNGHWLCAVRVARPGQYVPEQYWSSYIYDTNTGQQEHELPLRVFAARFWPCSMKVSFCHWENLRKEGRVHSASVYDISSSSIIHSHILEERKSRSEAWCLARASFRFSPNGRYLAYSFATDAFAQDESGLPIVFRILDVATGETIFDEDITTGYPLDELNMYGSWARAALEQPAVWNADSTALMLTIPGPSRQIKTEAITVTAGWAEWHFKGKAIAWSEDGKLLRTDRGLVPVLPMDQLLERQEHVAQAVHGDALYFPSYGRTPGPSLAELGSSFAPGGKHLCCTLPSGKFALYDIDCDAHAQQSGVFGGASTTTHSDGPGSHPLQPAVPSHAWSPDGSFLAFVLPSEKCMMIVTGAGQTHMRIAGEFACVHWSGDGRIIVAVYAAHATSPPAMAQMLNFG